MIFLQAHIHLTFLVACVCMYVCSHADYVGLSTGAWRSQQKVSSDKTVTKRVCVWLSVAVNQVSRVLLFPTDMKVKCTHTHTHVPTQMHLTLLKLISSLTIGNLEFSFNC